jgi:hypothetical protein
VAKEETAMSIKKDDSGNHKLAAGFTMDLAEEMLNAAIEGDPEEDLKSSRRLIQEINLEILDCAIN